MLRRQLEDRRVRVGLLLAVAVVLATILPGWWMLLVGVPLGLAVATTVGRPRGRHVVPARNAHPGGGGSSAHLTADDRVRSSADWLACLAAGLDVARAAEARRQALSRIEARARQASGDGTGET